MPKLRICAEIYVISEDENKNLGRGGLELNFGDVPEEGFEEKYKKLMETVTPEMILEQAGLSEIFEPKDCRIISPKEIEIIEHGKTYQVYTCPRCCCVFAACKIDGYKNDWDGKDWVECPECGEEIELKEMEW